jgi:predicted O-methyltransferase YrrM
MSFLYWNKWEKHLVSFWDKYLNELKNKSRQNTILEIGSYKGKSTCWMLENLASNPKSVIYALDTWEGSPEYAADLSFKTVEKEFDENTKQTKRTNQLIKMKMKSSEGLNILIEKEARFDFIYIDASHEARDVIVDAVLSWQILKPCGIIIFDDYEWDQLEQDYFRPKMAIDSFIEIFKPELKVLYKEYQVGVKKLSYENFEQPRRAKYYEIMESINKNIFCDMTSVVDFDIKKVQIKIKLEYSETKLNILSNKTKELFDEIKKNYCSINNNFFLEKQDIKISHDMKKNKFIINFLLKDNNVSSGTVISYFDVYSIFDLFDGKNNINCFILNRKNMTDKLINFIKKNKNIHVDYFKNNTPEILSFEDYEGILKNKNKYDSLYFMHGTRFASTRGIFELEYNNNIHILMNLILCLNMQKMHGNVLFKIPTGFTKFTIQLIYVLKMYYEKVEIKNLKSTKLAITVVFIAKKFKGISKTELNNFNNMLDTIKNENLFVFKSKKIKSFIELNKQSDEYNFIKNFLCKYENKKMNEIKNILKLYIDINSFVKNKSQSNKYKENIIKNIQKNTIINLYNLIYVH